MFLSGELLTDSIAFSKNCGKESPDVDEHLERIDQPQKEHGMWATLQRSTDTAPATGGRAADILREITAESPPKRHC